MSRDSKRAVFEDDRGDRISSLPSNIDYILEFLPVQDAARTSILSKKWRYIWAMLLNLKLDNLFCNKLASRSQYVFEQTIDKILLQHIGDIVKFDLDLSGVELTPCPDIDRWILYATRNGVKKLKLKMTKDGTYKVPSYIFNCSTLTKLKLFNCIVKLPNSFLGFQSLTTLHLERITFEPATEFCVINTPLVFKLILLYCKGTQYLDIVVSTRLEYLSLRESHDNLDLKCSMNCKRLKGLYHWVDSPIPADEKSSYEKFIFSLSKIETLILSSFVLELLSTGRVTRGLPFTPINCLRHLILGINLDEMGQTSYTIKLIKSFLNLSKLEIRVYAASDKDETVMKYLDKPACLDRSLDKLEDVVMHSFRGSKSELIFIKLLFARAQSLVRMNIKLSKGVKEERHITKELMHFRRASPKAELFYSTNAY